MKVKLTSLFLFIAVALSFNVQAKTVKTISVFSQKMGREIKNVVILPENYNESVQYPVVYLLHGYGGNHESWLKNKPELVSESSRWNIIIVCPDGEKSWYWDSPVNPDSQFETYVSKELVEYIDANYSTIKSPKGRAVTGFSMGGHGGLWLGINHPDVFGACGSISGGVDIRPFPNNWDMKKSLGNYSENPGVWSRYTVIEQLYKIEPGTLKIIIDCGTDDFFFEVNQALHKKMLLNNIQHDYIVRPGKHDGNYSNNSLDYQLYFFHRFFTK